MVSVCRCRCRRAVVNGSLDLAARAFAQHAFISLGDTGRCSKISLAATDESGQRRGRCKALQGNRTMRLCRDTRPDLSWQDFWRSHAPQGASLSVVVVCLSVVVCAVVNGSLDLAARAIVLQAFLFDEAKFVAA